jgi:3-dehydroquinate dehydratase I
VLHGRVALAIGTVPLGGRPRIVAAGGEGEVDALARADGADLVELRADLFADPTVERVTAALERLRAAGRPIILTARAASEGGRAMPETLRAAVYERGLPLVHAIDVETTSRALVDAIAPRARAGGVRMILSTHDFTGTPARDALVERLDAAFAAGADVAKLATHAASLADLQTLLDATRARAARPVVTLAMGPMGPLSRLVLGAAGSLLTYASVGTPTAPGQMPLTELATLLARLFPA